MEVSYFVVWLSRLTRALVSCTNLQPQGWGFFCMPHCRGMHRGRWLSTWVGIFMAEEGPNISSTLPPSTTARRSRQEKRNFEDYVTRFATHQALKLITLGQLTFREKLWVPTRGVAGSWTRKGTSLCSTRPPSTIPPPPPQNCILESQLPHKIVNLLFTITN